MVNRKLSKVFVIFSLLASIVLSEYNTSNSTYFPFLKMDFNSKISSLGGAGVALTDRFVSFNPASMSFVADNVFSVSYKKIILDAMGGELSYTLNRGKYSFGTKIHYISYGELSDLRDENNKPIDGVIKPMSTDFSFGVSKMVSSHVSVGGDIKYVYSKISNDINSDIHSYSADAFALNMGGIYAVNSVITLGIAIKNLGFIHSYYNSFDGATLPISFISGTKVRLGREGYSFFLLDMNKTLGDYLRFKTGLDFDIFRRYLFARLGFSFSTEDVKNIFSRSDKSSGVVSTNYTTDKSEWSLFSIGIGLSSSKVLGIDTSLNFRTNGIPPEFSLALNFKL